MQQSNCVSYYKSSIIIIGIQHKKYYDIRPPGGTCLQYHTELTGRIETFNFDGGSGQHLFNQQYSTCIRAARGFCCVNYQVCPDQLVVPAGAIAAPGFSFDGQKDDALTDADCLQPTQDYIAIPQSGKILPDYLL